MINKLSEVEKKLKTMTQIIKQGQEKTHTIKVTLDNGQGVPSLNILDKNNVIICKVHFCKDGSIIQLKDKSIGTRLGSRHKADQAEYVDAESNDGIELGEIHKQ